MRKAALFSVIAATVLACDPPRYSGKTSVAVTDRVMDEEIAYKPSLGRDAGLHDLDGKVGDYSVGGIQRQVQMLQLHMSMLANAHYFNDDEKLDIELLRWQASESLFWLVDAKSWQKDPAFYDELFSVSGYLDREYAPFEDRFRHLIEHEEAALEEVEWIYTNLKPPLPKPLVDVGIGIYAGYAEYLRGDVVKRTRESMNAPLQERFGIANEALAKEADKLVAWLKTVPTDQSHVLGPERFQKLVDIYAGQKMPLDEFERVGEADLAKNRALYEKYKGAEPIKVSDALMEARQLTEDARAFVISHNIVTMPRSDFAEVVETPPYLRYNFAWLSEGGPFEMSTGALFYVTPPDPTWPLAQREAYTPPRGELRSTCVHEVYPGHFVQAGFLRQAMTKAQKLVGSSTFIEGWAHYAEQMMLDEGFGDEPDGRLGQVTQALLRDCRYLVALGIHAKGMSLEAAEKRMLEDCHQSAPVAKQQALRGAFHPWYFAYTLGKLQILELREEVKSILGERFNLQHFHDAILKHGQGPLGLIRKRVIAELTNPEYPQY